MTCFCLKKTSLELKRRVRIKESKKKTSSYDAKINNFMCFQSKCFHFRTHKARLKASKSHLNIWNNILIVGTKLRLNLFIIIRRCSDKGRMWDDAIASQLNYIFPLTFTSLSNIESKAILQVERKSKSFLSFTASCRTASDKLRCNKFSRVVDES